MENTTRKAKNQKTASTKNKNSQRPKLSKYEKATCLHLNKIYGNASK